MEKYEHEHGIRVVPHCQCFWRREASISAQAKLQDQGKLPLTSMEIYSALERPEVPSLNLIKLDKPKGVPDEKIGTDHNTAL